MINNISPLSPTRIVDTPAAGPLGEQPASSVAFPLSLPDNFPLALSTEQQARLQTRLDAFSFRAMTLQNITTLGLESEMGLNKALDGFLSRIDKQSAPQLFTLVTTLNERVEAEKLPDLANQILNAKPTLLTRLIGMIYPKSLKEASVRLYEELGRITAGKTQTLTDVIAKMEAALRGEMNRTQEELQHLDDVKAAYRESFVSFAEESAFLHSTVAKAKAEFAAEEPELRKDIQLYHDAQDKLQSLESRALAVEGTMSRLPSDQLVIRQLQNAGVATLQELATTMASRFASIKMTLVSLNSALRVRNLQRLGNEGAELDRNLDQVRRTLMKDVVQTAATAPGQNRTQQAQQLQQIVADTRALQDLADAARKTNAQQFEAARAMMAQARQELLKLGQEVDPRATVANRAY